MLETSLSQHKHACARRVRNDNERLASDDECKWWAIAELIEAECDRPARASHGDDNLHLFERPLGFKRWKPEPVSFVVRRVCRARGVVIGDGRPLRIICEIDRSRGVENIRIWMLSNPVTPANRCHWHDLKCRALQRARDRLTGEMVPERIGLAVDHQLVRIEQ